MRQSSDMEREILLRIQPPCIPDRRTDITEHGAAAGSGRPQTASIQRAIDEMSAAGGGRVIVPSGSFETGALCLKSGVELCLSAPDSVLRFTAETNERNYPVVFSHWEGTPCYNYSALLYACGAHDIAVTGPGTLDGQAGPRVWWNWHHQEEAAWSSEGENLQETARIRLRQMNVRGVPVRERRFGDGHYLRPNFLQFLRCERVLIQGVTFRDSPMWNLNPVQCRSVTVRGVTFRAHGPNSDGCDPESCDGVLIEDCRFDTGDDCISLKSGRDRDGRKTLIPCENVVIRNNRFADGHGGIALGSEMSGGIRRVVARTNDFDSPDLTYAFRMKTNARRGGTVEDIVFSDSVVRSVNGAAVHGTMFYEDGRSGDSLPVFRNITIENLTAYGGDYGIFLEAFAEVPITGLTLRNIRIEGVHRELYARNWRDPVLQNVVINGKRFPRPCAVRILGMPRPGARLRAHCSDCGTRQQVSWHWELAREPEAWSPAGEGAELGLPGTAEARFVRVTATDAAGNSEHSIAYRIWTDPPPSGGLASPQAQRLWTRGLLTDRDCDPEQPVTRLMIARMIAPLLPPAQPSAEIRDLPPTEQDARAVQSVVAAEALPLREGRFEPYSGITREEMATVAMQACGVSYKNASTTAPVCADAEAVKSVHSTNVARALYFGFMRLDEENRFHPQKPVTWGQSVVILDAVADFAGR